MSEQHRAYLCVGGPNDGKRVASRNLHFMVAKQERFPTIIPSHAEALLPRSVDTMAYTATSVRTGPGSEDQVWFWRPSDQTLGDTLRLLLERYEQAANINWQDAPYP